MLTLHLFNVGKYIGTLNKILNLILLDLKWIGVSDSLRQSEQNLSIGGYYLEYV